MPGKIIVVDDDKISRDLAAGLLSEAGFEVEALSHPAKALERVRESGPAAAVLDILMPGMDGLTLCQRIKSDPGLRQIKVIIVSGKAYEEDRRKAHLYGADLFIEKPYDAASFVARIGGLLASSPAAEALHPPEIPATADARLKVRVWGSRGRRGGGASQQEGGELARFRYGSRSPCVSVEFAGNTFVFDAGGGLEALASQVRGPQRLWIFLTHFHQPHVEALGAALSRLPASSTVSLGAPADPGLPLSEEIARAVRFSAKGPIQAEIELYEMKEERYEVLPGIVVAAFYANHPGHTLGFRLDAGGRSLVYCPDSELYGEAATALEDYDDKLGRLCAGADLLIHDGRYSREDHQSLKMSGNSCALDAVDLAGRSKVKNLLLFHADLRYDDAALDAFGVQAAARAAEKGYSLNLAFARDGMEIGI